MNLNTLKNWTLIALLAIGLTFTTACGGGGEEETQEDNADTTATEEEATSEEEGESEGTPMELEAGMTPFDFPTTGIKAEEGDIVLTPGYKMYQNNLAEEDPTRSTFIFYTAEVVSTGDVESELEFTFDGTQKMPNSLIIPIPKGQSVAKGDIVLTWWQTGSGMQRAIVTDASNPTSPKVRYLDLDWDHPSTDNDSGLSIGQTEYELKPDTFFKLSEGIAPGNLIAVKDGSKYNSVQVISIEGDKVLYLGFAGKMGVASKADCKAVPLKPSVNPGDKVQAVWVGGFTEAEVVEVNSDMGVVFIKTSSSEKEPVSFGQIAASL